MPIPSELLDYKQWILWRRMEINGRIAKLPSWRRVTRRKHGAPTGMFVMRAGSFDQMVLDLCLRVAIHSAGSILTNAGPETERSRRKRRRLSTELQATRRYRPRVPVSIFW